MWQAWPLEDQELQAACCIPTHPRERYVCALDLPGQWGKDCAHSLMFSVCSALCRLRGVWVFSGQKRRAGTFSSCMSFLDC